MLQLLHYLWTHLASAMVGCILFATFLKKSFGIDFFATKIKNIAPAVWRWIMRSALFRREVLLQLNNLSTTLTELVSRVESNTLRIDLLEQRSHLMSFTMNREGAITYISDSFLKLFDVTKEEILGFAYENMIHEEDSHRVRDKWKRCCDKCSRFFDDHRMINKKGEYILCTVRGFPIKNNNSCSGFQGTIDIVDETNHHV